MSLWIAKLSGRATVLFTPVDKDGHLREEELLALVLDQYAAARMDGDD